MQGVLGCVYNTTAFENYQLSARGFVDNRSIICIETYVID